MRDRTDNSEREINDDKQAAAENFFKHGAETVKHVHVNQNVPNGDMRKNRREERPVPAVDERTPTD